MRVLVADDQPEVRSALRLIVEERDGISVTSEASTTAELFHQVKTEYPDMILLDWELPGSSSPDALIQLHKSYPSTPIIVLDSRPQTKLLAMSAGANEFVCKSDPPEHLLLVLDKFNERKLKEDNHVHKL